MVLSEGIQSSRPAVSIVVLAFNEAENLATTVESIHRAVDDTLDTYEVVIVDDGSVDSTGEVAETLAKQDSRIKAVHNPANMGCGYSFRRGALAAGHEYVWLIPGDGEISAESIRTIADHVGCADMVVPYVLNRGIRPLSRRVVSWGYTALLNILFRKDLRYYNGPCVIRTDLVRAACTVESRGFTFMAPMLLKLIGLKHTYVEVGIMLQPRVYGRPSVSSWWNILSAARTVGRLFWDINVVHRPSASSRS